jgi:SAM-dependent methyltransferase
MTERAMRDFEVVAATDFFRDAVADGSIVDTAEVDVTGVPGLDTAHFVGALQHKTIPFVSYPYEWSFQMLKAAALHQLRLIERGLRDHVITKDGSAFNTQWDGARPVFIDVGSLEPLVEGRPWRGYRQFCELFLYPLMLAAYKHVPFQPWLRGSLDGISTEEIRPLMTRRDYLRRGVMSHVVLHAKLQRRYEATSNDVGSAMKAAGFRTEMIAANVKRLIKLVESLTLASTRSEWSGYGERAHYSADALAQKEQFVRKVVGGRSRWALVWDLGCNDGRFSRLVADKADYVVAMDADPKVIDRLFLDLREEPLRNILPLCVNLADPTPALGWRHHERSTLDERGRPELVLCLALVHHLAITHNIPISELVAWLAAFDADVVVEFPHRDDPMVQTLLRRKPQGTHDDYHLAVFEDQLRATFSLRDVDKHPSSLRTVFHVAPRR